MQGVLVNIFILRRLRPDSRPLRDEFIVSIKLDCVHNRYKTCVYPYKIKWYYLLHRTSVRFGEHTISTEQDCKTYATRVICLPPYQDVAIQEVVVHEGFDDDTLHYDIALLLLSRSIEFTRKLLTPLPVSILRYPHCRVHQTHMPAPLRGS